MAYLMRMITPPRWIQEQHEITCLEDINAESLSDLSAEENAISTWYVGDKGENEIRHAVLALTSGFRSLDEIKVVYLDVNIIRQAGLSIAETTGITKIEEYANLHRDIDQLNAGKLIQLANIILEQVWNNQTQTFCAEDIALWMIQIINDGKLDFNSLDKNFRNGFASRVKKMINKKKIVLQNLNPSLQQEIERQWEQNKKRTNCKYENQCPKYGCV